LRVNNSDLIEKISLRETPNLIIHQHRDEITFFYSENHDIEKDMLKAGKFFDRAVYIMIDADGWNQYRKNYKYYNGFVLDKTNGNYRLVLNNDCGDFSTDMEFIYMRHSLLLPARYKKHAYYMQLTGNEIKACLFHEIGHTHQSKIINLEVSYIIHDIILVILSLKLSLIPIVLYMAIGLFVISAMSKIDEYDADNYVVNKGYRYYLAKSFNRRRITGYYSISHPEASVRIANMNCH
jgi:hypothetical protein